MGLLSGRRLAPVPKNIKRRFRRLIRVASKGVCTDGRAIAEQPAECKRSGGCVRMPGLADTGFRPNGWAFLRNCHQWKMMIWHCWETA